MMLADAEVIHAHLLREHRFDDDVAQRLSLRNQLPSASTVTSPKVSKPNVIDMNSTVDRERRIESLGNWVIGLSGSQAFCRSVNRSVESQAIGRRQQASK